MNFTYCVRELERNGKVLQTLIAGIEPEQAVWKPSPEEWSILEVVNHLLDEERNDFRLRIQHMFSGSKAPFPPNDPERYVIERNYNNQDLFDSMQRFLNERKSSLAWLNQLNGADWDMTYEADEYLKGIRAGDFMVSWAAHDLLHIRQINELKWAYGVIQGMPYGVRYAGEW